MNILMFLTPKNNVAYIEQKNTLRQALEHMDNSGFSAVPIIDEKGCYINTITEGDLLRYIKTNSFLDLKKAEKVLLVDVPVKKDIKPVNIDRSINEVMLLVINQNFVPVIDDEGRFIGIITRKSMMTYFQKNLKF